MVGMVVGLALGYASFGLSLVNLFICGLSGGILGYIVGLILARL